jgi:hypothetical protein
MDTYLVEKHCVCSYRTHGINQATNGHMHRRDVESMEAYDFIIYGNKWREQI